MVCLWMYDPWCRRTSDKQCFKDLVFVVAGSADMLMLYVDATSSGPDKHDADI